MGRLVKSLLTPQLRFRFGLGLGSVNLIIASNKMEIASDKCCLTQYLCKQTLHSFAIINIVSNNCNNNSNLLIKKTKYRYIIL